MNKTKHKSSLKKLALRIGAELLEDRFNEP